MIEGIEEKEFNLSQKVLPFAYKRKGDAVCLEDVKEFIKRLKEWFELKLNNETHVYATDYIYKQIDKLAGEKLKWQ